MERQHMKLKYILISSITILALFLTACGVNDMKSETSATPEPTITSAIPAVDSLPPATPEDTLSSTATTVPTPTKTSEAEGKTAFIKKTESVPATTIINVAGMDAETLAACFISEPIPDAVFARMDGKTFKKDCTTKRSDLRYVRVLHYGFDGKTHAGELVVNKSISKDILDIFQKLYKAKYPIEKMRLEDDYNADDDASMADNNTSSFNFRVVEGSKNLSRHALGLAIDINPLYNPYIVTINGKKKIEPPESAKYSDRKLDLPYIIKKGNLLYNLFIQHGFSWGGSWAEPDYQHFSKAE